MSMINQEDSDEPETFAGSKRKSLQNREGWIKRAKPISTHHIKQEQVCEEKPVRFSTKRSGEIGRFPMEWAKCVDPLVNSGKVKVLGRFMGAPKFLSMMQDIILSVSFFIHHSIFTDGDNYTVPPLLGVLNLLKIKPYHKAEFTAEELDSQKCLLDLQHIPDQAPSVLRLVKRGRGCQQYREENKDEEAISESSINKTGDAADVYAFEEMAGALMSDLSPYQKQALYRMLELEKGIDVEISAHTLHPCWVGYRICDERAFSIYVNIFSGEATTQFPTIIQMARGGIIADAMGLGKTVMTIALIIARPCRESSKNIEITKRQIDSHRSTPWKPKGGTLVVCPETFLSQWKDELETHSESQGISFLVYVRGRDNNNKMISEKDVVLTEYDILADAYAKDKENSIFHQVDWYRVVLDEAHNIESSYPQYAEATSSLSSHCRWCRHECAAKTNDVCYKTECSRVSASVLSIEKRGNAGQQNPEETKTISELCLNEIVGSEVGYNSEEMEPPSTLICDLVPYQKQSLSRMLQLETGIDVDRRATSIYSNMLPGTIQFPTTQQMARQGILVDAMTLGKTVMTTALMLARRRRVSSSIINITKKREIVSDTSLAFKPIGGTLSICPWSSLSQWKDELKTHLESESTSIFVYNDPGGISSYASQKKMWS